MVKQGNDLTLDHTCASPPPQVCHAVDASHPVKDQNHEQQQQHDDHSYAELSDVPTEAYGHDSDSQGDVITTGGKLIISTSE